MPSAVRANPALAPPTQVRSVAQYEANFKMIKQRRKELERLPDVIKLDCVRVSLLPFKAAVEDAFQRLADALLVSLRRAVLEDFKELDAFLNESMETLASRPASIEEITAAQAAWEAMGGAKPGTKALMGGCLEKKRCLLQHAPGSDVDVGEVVSRVGGSLEGEGGRWDNFEIAMDAFNEMILEQKEALRSVLADEVEAFNGSVERFADRWRALRPGAESAAKPPDLGDEAVVARVRSPGTWRKSNKTFFVFALNHDRAFHLF